MAGIYIIHNVVTNDIYIGKTKRTFEERWNEHRRKLNKGNQRSHLQNAWKKYGASAFEFDTLEETDDITEAESFWYQYFKYIGAGLYNDLEPDKEHPCSYRATEKSRKNRSVVHKTRWQDDDYRQAHLANINRSGLDEGRHSPIRKQNQIAAVSKTYTVVDPDGNTITFTNARNFARINGLNETGFAKILTGARKQYKNWKLA